MNNEAESSGSKSGYILSVFLLAFIGGVVWTIRPWLHGLFMMIHMFPVIIQAGVVGIGLAALVGWASDSIELSSTAFGFGFFGMLIVGMILVPTYTSVEMSDQLGQEYEEIDTLPDIDNDNPRVMPRGVADEFAENGLQEPRHRLGTSDIAIHNGTPYWTMPLQPDGLMNSLTIKQKGAAYVDMTTSQSNIDYDSTEMKYGVGQLITDNINWHLRKNKYWVNYEDQFVFNHEGDTYMATPYKEYSLQFKFPIVFTTPEFGGVALTDPEGNTEYVEAKDIPDNEVLEEQRVYPYDLANRYVSSMEYRNGIINAWFFHEDQLEVADLPGYGNDQPFMILTDTGPELFVATEPYGQASGLFEIWTIDAQTGDYHRYSLDRDSGLVGAERAMNYVRRANSRVNWADADSDTGFEPIEPLPVILDDQLYWQIRVQPIDSSGIAFTSFVNAEDGTVYTANTDEEIYDFLEGEELDESAQVGEDGQAENPEPSQPSTGDFTVKVIEDGEVVREFSLEDNQKLEVER